MLNNNYKFVLLVVSCFQFLKLVKGYTLINCFGSLPSSFTLDDTYEFQTSGYCYGQCNAKGYSYFALSQHDQCYCGSDNPASSESTSSSCTAYCFGYSAEMCGGTSAFSVYSVADTSSSSGSSVSSSSLLSSSSSPSSSSPTSSSTSSTTTASSSTSPLSSSQETSTSSTVSHSTSSSPATSVVYSTSFRTESGSTVYVTNTITAAQGTSSANSTSTGDSSNSETHKKKANIGAIVGGVVGGVGGALVIGVGILLIIRHINQRREQERMEKEYQEAIKPVEYNDKAKHGSSSLSLTNAPSSGSFDEDRRNVSSNNPFDDSRRISNGSILNGTTPGNPKILTVVNPDED